MEKPIKRELHVILHTNDGRLLGFPRVARPCTHRVVDDGDHRELQPKLPFVKLRYGARGSEVVRPSEGGARCSGRIRIKASMKEHTDTAMPSRSALQAEKGYSEGGGESNATLIGNEPYCFV